MRAAADDAPAQAKSISRRAALLSAMSAGPVRISRVRLRPIRLRVPTGSADDLLTPIAATLTTAALGLRARITALEVVK